MNRLEALGEAIAAYNGYREPDGLLYKLRNPGGLKAFSSRHIKDESGYRVFESVVDGWKALLDFDLDIKCKGNSNCGLRADSPLVELVRVFGMKDETTRYIVKFLRKALNRQDLTENTPISFFVQE